jgi:hypothetical protein
MPQLYHHNSFVRLHPTTPGSINIPAFIWRLNFSENPFLFSYFLIDKSIQTKRKGMEMDLI